MASPTQDRLFGANSSLAIKAPVKAATTGNITLSGTQTIDGVAVVADDRVLVKNQTTGAENGIYIVSTSTWTRAPDWDGSRDVTQGTLVVVAQGTVNAATIWRLTTSGTITIGTTSVAFAQANALTSDSSQYLTGVAGTNTITASATGLSAYAVGQRFWFTPANTNTGAVTLNINSLGAGAVQLNGAALTSAGELRANVPVEVLVTAATPVFEIIGNGSFLAKSGGTLTGALTQAVGANVASAATINLTNVAGNACHVTGTVAITGVTLAAGKFVEVIFDDALTLTHHATNNHLPGTANITTAANDRALYWSDGTTVYCLRYQRADGSPVVGGTLVDTTPLVKGSADATKQLRFEVDGFTTGQTRVITPPDRNLNGLGITLGTEQATTSGTSINFTIPSGARRVTIALVNVSTNGTSNWQVQLGDSGGIETTGYSGSCHTGVAGSTPVALNSAGFVINSSVAAANAYSGVVILCLEDATDFTWAQSANMARDAGTAEVNSSAGVKSLSAELTTVRITTVNGTDTFDAGAVNVSWEF